ncbi:MAG: YafY family transcriptional regulator [Rhodobacteraceae bacterium]|nr:YafY family transcriptional regulator [Paracoccaceae bacterium]
MARSDRLLQLMQLLRTLPAPVKAGRLAEELHISKRSIYRDIDSLRVTGAIIDGAAGYGYTLVEDPALPPMMFNADEMEALVLGLREVREVGDPVLANAAENVLSKVTACLPDRMRMQIQNSVLHAKRFHERPKISVDVAQVRLAAREEWALQITYGDVVQNVTERKIWPLSIVFMDQTLVLLAKCQMRQDFRVFRMDRISKLEMLTESFRPHRISLLRDCLAQINQGTPGTAASRASQQG